MSKYVFTVLTAVASVDYTLGVVHSKFHNILAVLCWSALGKEEKGDNEKKSDITQCLFSNLTMSTPVLFTIHPSCIY